MLNNPATKYAAFAPVDLPIDFRDRTWPNNAITAPPVWLSTDLRDGNQALIEPMDIARKLRLFRTLVDIGFKEIEIGFPSASQTEFDFARRLIEQNLIPSDVTIQVLTPARESLIHRTFEALRGAQNVIVHVYNATAPTFRQVVFNLDKPGTIRLATEAAALIKTLAAQQPHTNWRFQYSPEVFTSTELPFAKEICNAVLDIWQPTPEAKTIINLPASVEVSTPNVFADQVEWMHRHLHHRNATILCVHPHNDRGCSVAAAELGQMAGAQRVEGCLFGNGERTGNVDLVTLAMNLYTQGISPGLDFSHIDEIVRVAEDCTQLPVHPRHPYAGELVFTAFSGSHQDAIRKGFAARKPEDIWSVPYLPMDPADVGRSYESVVRVNSQSGKGGIAFLLERDYGIVLPRKLQIELSQIVQKAVDVSGKEMTAAAIWEIFCQTYLQSEGSLQYVSHRFSQLPIASRSLLATEQKATVLVVQRKEHSECTNASALRYTQPVTISSDLIYQNEEIISVGQGNGPIDAFVNGLNTVDALCHFGEIEIRHYEERSLGRGSQKSGNQERGSRASAIALIEITAAQNSSYGIGIHKDIVVASFQSIISALNRLQINEMKTVRSSVLGFRH